MLTPKGNFSTKLGQGSTWKRHIRTEEIARLVLAGFSEAEIAFSQNISIVRVNQIKRTPEYVAKRIELETGVISKHDEFLRENIENGHAELRAMVPSALLALRDSLLNKMNPKLRFEAAKEVMDREGSLAKVSKTQVTVKNNYDYSEDDLVSGDLLAALQNINGTNHTPEETGAGVFSCAALGADAQKELQSRINLADFDIKTPVQ